MQSTKSVIISKLIMLPECKFTTQNLQWIQFHQDQLSKYFPTLEIIIHTKVHNLLGHSKAFKLVFCYMILRGSVELDY